VNDSINGGGGRGGHSSNGGGRSPEKVLGSDTAHKLESQGEEGQAVAELATESAATTAGEGGSSGGSSKSDTNGRKHPSGKAGLDDAVAVAGAGGSASAPADTNVVLTAAEGSSGVDGVLSHATGSSSGEMGIFLPLLLLAVPICALIYVWRRRQPDRAAP
jgi:hypothetical protein